MSGTRVLPANRREFMDMFVDPITQGFACKTILLRRMRGVISSTTFETKKNLYPSD
jgi:hypothetical protein